jgi:hypothetical protein
VVVARRRAAVGAVAVAAAAASAVEVAAAAALVAVVRAAAGRVRCIRSGRSTTTARAPVLRVHGYDSKRESRTEHTGTGTGKSTHAGCTLLHTIFISSEHTGTASKGRASHMQQNATARHGRAKHRCSTTAARNTDDAGSGATHRERAQR